MKTEYFYDDEGDLIGTRTSYENQKDCSDGNHDMEYPQTLGLVGGICRRCGYKTC